LEYFHRLPGLREKSCGEVSETDDAESEEYLLAIGQQRSRYVLHPETLQCSSPAKCWAWHVQVVSFPPQGSQPLTRYAQKTIAFHFEFGSEIIENARYGMTTLYSMEHLKIANAARDNLKDN
jgi:hypothetical protein